ncbi:hypothetical protein ASPZODRAFT_61779 [Penicilliopsis zonata CBS 506.65]|uniref:ER membrane protein complex subunit 1 n=1 Tax=Penicilliopsis zonata CBS 506.65 TaxID=1073090 RepID=A0A1L9SMS7_9EURO|nr:hypothetical protein ASPZODRAFT_61779 [Penicilliopsis zonata CBS 506.65]OJJ48401.1 hypothetical protein ASPZODRAFT_61779 [Penicilliopsis zonata CBS 506.65]
MRLQAALFLLAACVPSATAVFKDEVDHVDFHHALLGIPSVDTTFFLRPSASSSASLLYTLSEKSILGAVNPRDGSIVWRQNITRSSLSAAQQQQQQQQQGFLRGSDESNTVVSAVGADVSSWSAVDGKLVWENRFAGETVADLEVLEFEDASHPATVKDTIALFAGAVGTVRRFDGGSGDVKWEFKDQSGDLPFQVLSSPAEIYYISLHSVPSKGYKIKITSLDPLTGKPGQQYVLSSENEVAGPESVLFVGANNASPLVVWADKLHKTLKVNVIGSKQVHTITIDNESGEEIRSITVHASRKLNSLPHFLVQYETESSSWADVYHVDLKASTVSKAYHLPRTQERSVFATSNKDANVYFTRMSESEAAVVSSASHGILGRWSLQSPSTERPLHAVAEVVVKGDSVALRSAVVTESGDWHLIQNGQSGWTRYEALAGALAATWVEADDQEELAHELEVEGHQSLLGAYFHRVKRHVRDLQYLPDWLRELPSRVITSVFSDEVTNLDSFGINMPVIVATENGRVYALDTGKHGAVAWSVKAAEGQGTWDVRTIVTQPGSATVYVEDGSSVTLNTTSGAILSRTAPTTKTKSFAVVKQDASSPVVIGVKEDGTPLDAINGAGFLVTLGDDGRVRGWTAADNKYPVWEFAPPEGQRIVRATARPAHDPVASIGKVLGDRSVLYKYLNPNLALVTAVSGSTASFYLLDAISGQLLHASTQRGVDTTQPIPSVISENWFAYSFYGDAVQEGDARGYQLVVAELYESPTPNDRGPLGSASNYSSLFGAEPLPAPHVISQAFVIPEPISHMTVTQTRQGITTRQLLCTLPASNSLIGIPRPVLDPRRPVGRDATALEAEEGLFKYHPFLEFDGKWYISHARDVAGLSTVLSRPTLLESTSLVFAFGGDIFASRVNPSQAFDILGKGFSKLQLVLTVVALAVGVVILAPMVRRKQINAVWKASS